MKMNVMGPHILVTNMHCATTQLGHLDAFVNLVLVEMGHSVKVC